MKRGCLGCQGNKTALCLCGLSSAVCSKAASGGVFGKCSETLYQRADETCNYHLELLEKSSAPLSFEFFSFLLFLHTNIAFTATTSNVAVGRDSLCPPMTRGHSDSPPGPSTQEALQQRPDLFGLKSVTCLGSSVASASPKDSGCALTPAPSTMVSLAGPGRDAGAISGGIGDTPRLKNQEPIYYMILGTIHVLVFVGA